MPTLHYRAWLARLATPPLDGFFGSRLLGLFGLVGDMIESTAEQSVLARLLRAATQPSDALRLIGSERNMPRYAGESDIVYRARLLGAWRAWSTAGTARAVEDQLRLAGLPDAKVVERFDWNWDTNVFDWARFWVVVKQHAFVPWVLSDNVTLSDDITLGTDMTPTEVSLFRQIIRKWKPAHMRCDQIIFVFDPARWANEQPDGTWSDETHRSTSAEYIPG